MAESLRLSDQALFVDKLFTNAGVTALASTRAAAINEFGSATTSADAAARGRALRRVGENSTLAQQEFNRAFVLMQYFGYLRRDANTGPDTDFSGYNFSIGLLTMVTSKGGRLAWAWTFGRYLMG
jgi:hypothetical protein